MKWNQIIVFRVELRGVLVDTFFEFIAIDEFHIELCRGDVVGLSVERPSLARKELARLVTWSKLS